MHTNARSDVIQYTHKIILFYFLILPKFIMNKLRTQAKYFFNSFISFEI